jgi:hypothetical protein
MTIINLGPGYVDSMTFTDILVWLTMNDLYYEFKNTSDCIISVDDEDAVALKIKFGL